MLVMWPGMDPGTAEGPGATLSRSFSAFRRSTSSWGKKSRMAWVSSCVLAAPKEPRQGSGERSHPHLHVMHGLPQLLQLVSRVEGLQADVRQLHLLLPQLRAQL